jgi:hypothetical protein
MWKRGDSGRKKTEIMTIMHVKHWRSRGILQDQSFWMYEQPKVTKAAGIEPPNHPQL